MRKGRVYVPELVIPEGKATGCLPRKYLPGQACGFAADHIEIIPEEDWEDCIADGGTLFRDFCGPVKDQDGAGSCATESNTKAVETARMLQGLEWVELNPWFIYHTTSGGRDAGSSLDENLAFTRTHGIAPESVWPRSKGWRAKPSDDAVAAALDFRILEFYELTSTREVGSALIQRFPVVYGKSSHSMCLVGLKSKRVADNINSWGAEWNDGGYSDCALSSINFAYGCYCVRVAESNQESVAA